MRRIFALKRQKKLKLEKLLQHSYHRIHLRLKFSQNSMIFHRSLFPEKATPELTWNDWDTTLHFSSQSLMSFGASSCSPV